MKIKSRKNKLPIVIMTTIAVLLLVGAVFVYLSYQNQKQDSSQDKGVDYNKPSEQQIKAGDSAKGSTINKDASNNSEKSSGANGSTSLPQTDLKTHITTASVQDGILYIRNDINGIYQDGTCTVSLSKGDSLIKRTAGIQSLPQSSTCKGFNIPTSNLTRGTWEITLEVTIGSKKAVATGEVEV